MRALGSELAAAGFVAIRLDYPGTGDSSGSLNEIDVQREWVNSIGQAAAYLRSLGLTDVSAVGMRLGAIVAATANADGLALSSLVLWDPCESGRNFLREISALESLRRADYEAPDDGSVVTSEWVFSPNSVEQIRALDLRRVAGDVKADRLLVITRDDRPFPERLRQGFAGRSVEWETTSEQGPMLDVEPLLGVLATSAIDRIAKWLDAGGSPFTPCHVQATDGAALVRGRRADPIVRERFVHLGRRSLFGIVSEPLGPVRGPLIVFFNAANEEHIGTSRLWVEFSRAWSALGLRCLRFDVTGVGDSPAFAKVPNPLWFEKEWIEDVEDVLQEMQSDDPANTVLIGLCSGAYLAAEGAFMYGARAACLINPIIGVDLVHASVLCRRSRVMGALHTASLLRFLHLKGQWIGTGIWQVLRLGLPRRYSEDLIATVAANGSALLVLASVEELSPYQKYPGLRSIDRHRLTAPRGYRVDFIPGLDHGMHAAKGRALAIAAIDEFVRNLCDASSADDSLTE